VDVLACQLNHLGFDTFLPKFTQDEIEQDCRIPIFAGTSVERDNFHIPLRPPFSRIGDSRSVASSSVRRS
jgi:hypothetical protein